MSSNLNSILLEGNMVRDPQYRVTPKGSPVCTFTMASNRYFRQDNGYEKEVSFFNVETWGKLAEACNKQGKKGRGLRAVGRLRQDRWQGEDGKPHARITIVAEHVEFRPEFAKAVKADEDLADIEQDALPDEEMTDESRVVEVTEAVA
jgi:single-strand DNA-binding protein